MKFRKPVAIAAIVFPILVGAASTGIWIALKSRDEQAHFEHNETHFLVSQASGLRPMLFKAGKDLSGAVRDPSFSGISAWLPPGNFFLEADRPQGKAFYPLPILGYGTGPERDFTISVTIRAPGPPPPLLLPASPAFKYIPSGHFLLGNRLNPQELHYVWLTGFYISSFEATNAEFLEFFSDRGGYGDDANWTEAGTLWKRDNASRATALMKPSDPDFRRFGQPDQPVVQVNWYEANAYCRWLTRRLGGKDWWFTLPNEAEWEKSARGPDSFDYGLGNVLSDAEIAFYNWKKNPTAEVTLVGINESRGLYIPNRFGLYHMTGNAAEWTQSIYRPYNRNFPFTEDDRNLDTAPGLRVVRGGSWYSASVASLSIAYRETFQPEVSTPYLGFRVAAKYLK